MKGAKAIFPIPLFKDKQVQEDSSINGLIATISSFKDILLERITRIENKLETLEKKKIPNNTKDISKIKTEVKALNNLYEKVDNSSRDSIQSITSHISDALKSQVDINKTILETIADTSFKANYELFDKIKIIETNINNEYTGLREFISNQHKERIDYDYITENFKDVNKQLNELKFHVYQNIPKQNTNKYNNPYVYEAVYKKELPDAEFTHFGKALVYKDGLFKNKISFYKNDGKKWLKVK